MFVRAGYTTLDAAAMTVAVIEADGVPVLGTVLNECHPRTSDSGYYRVDDSRIETRRTDDAYGRSQLIGSVLLLPKHDDA